MRHETNGRGFTWLARRPQESLMVGYLYGAAAALLDPVQGAFCCQLLRNCLQDGRTEALCWWPANKSPDLGAFGCKHAAHTHFVVDTPSPYGATLYCGALTKYTLVRVCSPGPLPVPCYAIGGVTVRVFSHASTHALSAPSPDSIVSETLAFTVLCFCLFSLSWERLRASFVFVVA